MVEAAVGAVAAIVETAIDAVAAVVQPAIDPVAAVVQAPVDTIAPLIQSTVDTIAPLVQALCLHVAAGGCCTVRALIEPVVDAVASLVEAAVDAVTALVETLVDAITPLIETFLDAVAALVQALLDAVTASVEALASCGLIVGPGHGTEQRDAGANRDFHNLTVLPCIHDPSPLQGQIRSSGVNNAATAITLTAYGNDGWVMFNWWPWPRSGKLGIPGQPETP